jgi:hypothetical protein
MCATRLSVAPRVHIAVDIANSYSLLCSFLSRIYFLARGAAAALLLNNIAKTQKYGTADTRSIIIRMQYSTRLEWMREQAPHHPYYNVHFPSFSLSFFLFILS